MALEGADGSSLAHMHIFLDWAVASHVAEICFGISGYSLWEIGVELRFSPVIKGPRG